LVWLQRYAPLAGRQRVPQLEDLYWRRLAFVGWGIWTAGVALETVAVGLGVLALSRVAGVLVAAGLLCFLVNVGRIANHWRAPAKDSGAGSGNRGRLAPAGVPATPAPPRS
ncbi:MAG: hypothetical protein IT337_07000, partial [Thermomicrobiales bacterium]|nr:hypothetical protein [Thermomicrobiales bacterium]